MTVLATVKAVADALKAATLPHNPSVITVADEARQSAAEALPLVAVWPEEETTGEGVAGRGSVIVAVTVNPEDADALGRLDTILGSREAPGVRATVASAGRLQRERGQLIEAEDGRLTWADEWSCPTVAYDRPSRHR